MPFFVQHRFQEYIHAIVGKNQLEREQEKLRFHRHPELRSQRDMDQHPPHKGILDQDILGAIYCPKKDMGQRPFHEL